MERRYRSLMHPEELVGYQVTVNESDLMIYTTSNLSALAFGWLRHYRQQIIDYAQLDQRFFGSLVPLDIDQSAPEIVQAMGRAAALANVGPMAAVAGAVAEFVGRKLAERSTEVIVENGGDIYLHGQQPRNILIHAGKSPFSERIAIRLQPDGPLSICTSAGTFGHSLSFGRADAAVAISRDASLADAMATAIGNITKGAEQIDAALELAKRTPGVLGSLVIVGEKLGMIGQVELVNV